MSFSDMMASGRGPGVIGMIMALFVLIGFGLLFMFAFDEGFQGGDQSIESIIAQQSREIESSNGSIGEKQRILAAAPARAANSKDLARAKRENQSLADNILALKKEVSTRREDLTGLIASFEKYKDQYRAHVRSKAKGEAMAALETRSGIVYKNVMIREVTPIGIQIRHDDGQKRIPFEELPDSMKDHFQFDPAQKEKAIAAESATQNEHEAAVAVTNQQLDVEMAQRRAKEAEDAKEKMIRTIELKVNRIRTLDDEIEYMEEAILLEAKKTVSRASIMRVELAGKRREITELQSQISTLRSRL